MRMPNTPISPYAADRPAEKTVSAISATLTDQPEVIILIQQA